MKEYDRVKLTVEKEKYAVDGVHKGMVGWICDSRVINNQRLVCFDESDLPLFPTIPVKEKDLEVVWEYPIIKIGNEVLLFTEKYINDGLRKGLKGFVIAPGSIDNSWTVHFDKQAGLQNAIDIEIVENDIIINR